MTETKWTNGPWLIKSEHPYYRITCLNRYLCEVVPTYDDKSQYNAQLMVAAPDLYAATDWVDSKLQTFWSPDMDDLDEVDVTLTYREIRALIHARRKARGEP